MAALLYKISKAFDPQIKKLFSQLEDICIVRLHNITSKVKIKLTTGINVLLSCQQLQYKFRKNMYSRPTIYYYYSQNQFQYYQPSIFMPMWQQPINFYILPSNYGQQVNRNLSGNQFASIDNQPKIEQNSPTVKSEPEVNQSAKMVEKKRQLKDLATSKKNGESNITNRFFTFFQNQERSKPMLQHIISKVTLKHAETSQKIIENFYVIITLLSTTQKRTYVNRKNLIDLMIPERLHDKLHSLWRDFKQEIQVSLETLSNIFRVCIQIFIKKWSLLSILNSRRISKTSKREYLRRRREIERQIHSTINLLNNE